MKTMEKITIEDIKDFLELENIPSSGGCCDCNPVSKIAGMWCTLVVHEEDVLYPFRILEENRRLREGLKDYAALIGKELL